MKTVNKDKRLNEKLIAADKFVEEKKLDLIEKYYISNTFTENDSKVIILTLKIDNSISYDELQVLNGDFRDYINGYFKGHYSSIVIDGEIHRYNSVFNWYYGKEMYSIDYNVVSNNN